MHHLSDDLATLTSAYAEKPQTDYKKALSCFATGVTVVTTRWQDMDWGMTCNSFASVSLDPRMVLWSIRKAATSLDAFTHAKYFSVSVLSAAQDGLAHQFSAGDMASRFVGVDVKRQFNQCLRLTHSVACFDCELHEVFPAGDHMIILGRVLDFESRDAPALGFWRSAFGQFHHLSA